MSNITEPDQTGREKAVFRVTKYNHNNQIIHTCKKGMKTNQRKMQMVRTNPDT